jgi:hypothetical protein
MQHVCPYAQEDLPHAPPACWLCVVERVDDTSALRHIGYAMIAEWKNAHRLTWTEGLAMPLDG